MLYHIILYYVLYTSFIFFSSKASERQSIFDSRNTDLRVPEDRRHLLEYRPSQDYARLSSKTSGGFVETWPYS